MADLSPLLSGLQFDVHMSVEWNARPIQIHGDRRGVTMEISDVATGWALCRSPLPRDAMTSWLRRTLASMRTPLVIQVDGREVARFGYRPTLLGYLLSIPGIQINAFALAHCFLRRA